MGDVVSDDACENKINYLKLKNAYTKCERFLCSIAPWHNHATLVVIIPLNTFQNTITIYYLQHRPHRQHHRVRRWRYHLRR